jgi:CheY-like chemotaxis protein
MARILVVDDEAAIREVIVRVLEAEDHVAYCAADGIECLRALENTPVDLIILDVFMPKQDGIETLRQVRRSNPDTRILVMSTSGQVGKFDPLEAALKLGADAVLEKPFNTGRLRRAVRDVLALPAVRRTHGPKD